MTGWTAIALALREPGDDAMASRLPTYLHPLAGRPLIWHMLSHLAALEPAPDRVVLLTRSYIPPEVYRDVAVQPLVPSLDGSDAASTLAELDLAADEPLLLVDGAAPTLGEALQARLPQPPSWMIAAEAGGAAAALLPAESAISLLAAGSDLAALASEEAIHGDASAALVVRSRAGLARAISAVRDRLVERLMEEGVTFLLPETVMVDVDVRIGRDSIIYPGTVIEGQTSIGAETVVGPGCRLVDAQIGSGVELKGWNYVSRIAVRNRAILEAYVRRGFD